MEPSPPDPYIQKLNDLLNLGLTVSDISVLTEIPLPTLYIWLKNEKVGPSPRSREKLAFVHAHLDIIQSACPLPYPTAGFGHKRRDLIHSLWVRLMDIADKEGNLAFI